jgi:hypothetical protein
MLFSLSAARPGRVIGFFVAAAATVAVTASVARADVKLVANMTTGGTTQTVTNYYKGNKVRSETKSSVVLMDSSGKMTMLNPTRKTYMVVSMGDMPGMNMVDVSSSVDIKPGGKTKTILGKPAKNYVYTATIKMSLKKAALDQMKASGRMPKQPPQLPTFVLQGENWVTEAVNLPKGAVATSLSGLNSLPGMKPIMDKFAAIKGVSLESRATITFKGGPQNMKPQTTSFAATSISETILPDALFQIPAGYTKQEMMPGGMGRRPGM